MGWMAAARRLDDRVLGCLDSPRARRLDFVLTALSLVAALSVTAANAWSGSVGLMVAAVLVAPTIFALRRLEVRGPGWAKRAQRSERPLLVWLRRWDARVFRARPSQNRLLDFVNSVGNREWVASALLGIALYRLFSALVYQLAGRHELTGDEVRSAGWFFVLPLASRFAWQRRAECRR